MTQLKSENLIQIMAIGMALLVVGFIALGFMDFRLQRQLSAVNKSINAIDIPESPTSLSSRDIEDAVSTALNVSGGVNEQLTNIQARLGH